MSAEVTPIGEVDPKSFVNNYKEIFYSAAGTRDISFVPNSNGQFYIDFEKGDVAVGPQKGMSSLQSVFGVSHELGHFSDLVRDSEAVLENFNYFKKRAKELAPRATDILKKVGKYDSSWDDLQTDEKTGESMTKMEGLIYGEFHTLYNCIDDVSVNRRVGQKFGIFNSGDGKRQIESLYKNVFFSEPDLSQELLHRQLDYALLLRSMTPEGTYQFDDRINNILNGYRDSATRAGNVTLLQEFSNITNPAREVSNGPKYRHQQIAKVIEPTFVELLMEDIAKTPPKSDNQQNQDNNKSESEQNSDQDQKNQDNKDEKGGNEKENEKKEGEKSEEQNKSDEDKKESDENKEDKNSEGEQGQNEKEGKEKGEKNNSDPWKRGENDPKDPISEKDVKNFKKKKEEKKEKEKQNSKSVQEKADDAQSGSDKKVCDEHGLNKKVAEKYREIEKEVLPYKEKLADVFEQFMQTIQQQIKTFYLENCRTGKFNVDTFIRKYGDQMSDPKTMANIPWEGLDTYDQKDIISRLALQPSEIYFHLILDGSGSMEEERIEAVRKMATLFLEGLGTFESRVNLRFRFKEPFKVNTEIRMFGSDTEVVKPFSSYTNVGDEIASRFTAINKINSNYGGTEDCRPLKEISESLTEERKKAILARKAMELAILITDGGSGTAEESKKALDTLKQKGVIAKGLQIGNPNHQEVEIFNSIWRDNGAEVASLDQLPPVLVGLLSDFLKNISPQIQFYEVEDME